jgi:hypothetical protein
MKLVSQVCTLEQAKRLSRLGITQGLSIFFWDDYEGKQQLMMNETPEDGYKPEADNTCFSAFTVAELGAMMPDRFQYYGDECFFESTRYTEDIQWIAGVHTVWAHDKPVVAKKYYPAATEAQARAELLIHLLEKQITTADDVNQRLQNP